MNAQRIINASSIKRISTFGSVISTPGQFWAPSLTSFPFNITVRHAGHSKWQNIRHTKATNDYEKSRINSKYSQLVKFAIREYGSPDPRLNTYLARILNQAKAERVPQATLQKAMDHKGKELKSQIVKVKVPGGCFILVETESESEKTSKNHIVAVTKKFGASLADDSVLYLFTHRGTILCSKLNAKPVTENEIDIGMEHAIEVGAEEVSFVETDDFGPCLEFTTDAKVTKQVSHALQKLGYEVSFNETDYIPKTPVELSPEHLKSALGFIEKVSSQIDVVRVYDNIGNSL